MSRAIIATLPGELAKGVDALEPLPVTAQRLFQLLRGDNVSLSGIAELIEFDQAITAAVLREASTFRYAGHSRVTPSVRDAVLRMGTFALLNLVLDGYMGKLRVSAPMYDLSEHELWLHGAAAQLAVRALRAERPRAGIPDLADTAAMMHDIGKLVAARHLKVEVSSVLACAHAKGLTFVEAERETIGTDHAEIGAAVAEHWQFPEGIVEAIRFHHAPHLTRQSPLLDAVVISNLVAKTLEVGLGAEGLNLQVDPKAHHRLGLDFAGFGRVCLQTEEWLRELSARHGVPRDVPTSPRRPTSR